MVIPASANILHTTYIITYDSTCSLLCFRLHQNLSFCYVFSMLDIVVSVIIFLICSILVAQCF